MIEYINKFDLSILEFIHNNLQNCFFDKIMPPITSLGEYSTFWFVLGFVLIISKKYRKAGILTVLAVLFTIIIDGAIIKNIVQRPRPFLQVTTINMIIAKPLDYSFPSVHTAAAVAACLVLFKTIKKYSIPFIFLAILIAFSRLYLFVHYPSDVLAGAILGLISSKIVLYFSKKSKYFSILRENSASN
ncbi:phosphatase PAP2 family protein [Clostridium sp. JS66]|uniref:phosphatase PAP2 family protein n=1 Tax=Clostridium sp. JS66 TaxID=3064705 RepID=UPI00298EBD5E|nr:phosphatase PAP2 family protein [Clostridium sp. JS66]WPC43722.1 phosphatase PAP2 family protein [Clostridium sp. JS66]